MSNKKMITKNMAFEFREIKEKDGSDNIKIISGIANKYDFIDYGYDRTNQGAFKETVKKKPIVPALWSHYSSEPVGLAYLSETKKGLEAKIELNTETVKGKESYVLAKQYLEAGRPMQLSIGFWITEVKYSELDNGEVIREILGADVDEVSITPLAMNKESEITEVKKLPSHKKGGKKMKKIFGINIKKLSNYQVVVGNAILDKAQKEFKSFIKDNELKSMSFQEFINSLIDSKISDENSKENIIELISDKADETDDIINEVLNGKVEPSDDIIEAFSEVLDVEIETLTELADINEVDETDEVDEIDEVDELADSIEKALNKKL